jgi:serine O-acetyltransferase
VSLRPEWWPDHRRSPESSVFLAERRQRHPRFVHAVLEDARVHAQCRREPIHPTSRKAAAVEAVRLAVISDAFLAQAMYRAKAALQRRGVPLLPAICHRLAITLGQVCIGDPVVMAAGVYLVHGQVVIDGLTEIGHRTRIAPFTTVGLRAGGLFGPTIGSNVAVGTGSRLLGDISIGDGAVIGANSVVIRDVEQRTTVAGVPATLILARDQL